MGAQSKKAKFRSVSLAKKQGVRRLSLSYLAKCVSKKESASGERNAEAEKPTTKAERATPLYCWKQALKDQCRSNQKITPRVTLKRIADAMAEDDVTKAIEICLRVNSQVGEMLQLCFYRQKELNGKKVGQ